ncbi:glycosyltransferase family 4 protein [Litorivicinus sp.]|nr:glycosyltransferase family 4 protein [Litorivicinus sp.]
MESYVWELTHALTKLGLQVEVICEQIHGAPDPSIQIHTVKEGKSLSRWRSMRGFRAKVDTLITEQFHNRKVIIHSHERTLNHHVTTFHGPPMEAKTDWWRFTSLSNRIRAWKMMEKDEILSPKVQFVLPVSNLIKDRLVSLYPEIETKTIIIANPGIHQLSQGMSPPAQDRALIKKFVFVGKEWKRKGLKFAVELANFYSSRFNDCTLDVYGPAATDLPRSVREHPLVMIKGWSAKIPWHEYDALIHPATSEPFGMVIPEARSRGVPVLTTNLVGSTELNYNGIIVLDISESIEKWADSLFKLANDKNNRKTEIKWTWQDLAMQHFNEVYPLVKTN